MAKIEFVVNVVTTGTNSAVAVDTLVQSANSGTSQYALYTNAGQIAATVTGIFPILAPIGLQTNTLAGTMTFLKIVADMRDGKGLNVGDTLTLVGNVAGIVATFTVLAGGAPALVLAAAGLGILAGGASIFLAENGLKDWTIHKVQDLWPQQPIQDYSDRWYDIQGRVRRYEDIINDPNSGFSMITVDSKSWTWTESKSQTPPPPRGAIDIPPPEEVDGDGQW